jgi:hypothetical protein
VVVSKRLDEANRAVHDHLDRLTGADGIGGYRVLSTLFESVEPEPTYNQSTHWGGPAEGLRDPPWDRPWHLQRRDPRLGSPASGR